MLDQDWLDQLSEAELTQVYDDCRFQAKAHRRHRSFALAAFWNLSAVQCCNAIGKLYKTEDAPAEQMTLADCPPRVAPEARA